MYSKFCNDLMRSCCGEDVAEKTKGLAVKKTVLLRVKRGSLHSFLITQARYVYRIDQV